jgi:transposase
MSRHDISDVQWAVIAPLIPKQKLGPGRKRNDDRQTLNGILFVLKTGCTWADVPRVYGSPSTCWQRFCAWSDGTWEHLWRALAHYRAFCLMAIICWCVSLILK